MILALASFIRWQIADHTSNPALANQRKLWLLWIADERRLKKRRGIHTPITNLLQVLLG